MSSNSVDAIATGVLLAIAGLAVHGITVLGLWSWVSSALIAASVFFFVRALFVDNRPATPTVKFDLGPGWAQQPKQTYDVDLTKKGMH